MAPSISMARAASFAVAAATVVLAKDDPCVKIAGATWVAPADARACMSSFAFNETIRENVLDVLNKTFSTFHISSNYQIQAPAPFAKDVHEDIIAVLASLKQKHYSSDLEFQRDVRKSVGLLRDGHAVWTNLCYDFAYDTVIPTPLVLLADKKGQQAVYIDPQAYAVASAEYADQIEFWQNATGGKLKELDGAKVLAIDGIDAMKYINDYANTASGYQAFGTRQNMFFGGYARNWDGWKYVLGTFAYRSLPEVDSVTLTVIRENMTKHETFTIPFRSVIEGPTLAFDNGTDYQEKNCYPFGGTNGFDLSPNARTSNVKTITPNPRLRRFMHDRLHIENKVMDDQQPLDDPALPEPLLPTLPEVNGSYSFADFFMLKDGSTGVLGLGSFEAGDYDTFVDALLEGLKNLKSQGATQLIVDVTNNGGGWICAAHWLHRILAGPKSTTVPQAGLNTTIRAQPLARAIVANIASNNSRYDPQQQLLYNPLHWRNVNNQQFASTDNWLKTPIEKVINGRKDYFSQTIGNECQPEDFPSNAPSTPLFDTRKIAIMTNGRCGSSCALFSVTMAKLEGAKTVVVGGLKGVNQQYAGTVGGQSSGFFDMDTQVKTAKLKNHPDAPPDLIVGAGLGITWRLGYGILDPSTPEEWQDRTADYTIPLTKETVSKPQAIWEAVAKEVF